MIAYYQIRSPLSQITEEHMARYIGAVSAELGEPLEKVPLDRYLAEDFALLYVASGGSEAYFLEVFGRLASRRVYILTSGESNSLAASMEILSYLNAHGASGEILHGDVAQVAARIRVLRAAHRAKAALRGAALGCIGEPSDWLIASDYDAAAMRQKLGLEYVKIGMDELVSEIARNQYEENQYTRAFKAAARGGPVGADDVEKALFVYGAVKRLCDEYKLAAVTVRCFDLLYSVHTTGCLAMSVLNDEGICGGCEGDVPSLLSMLILRAVTGQPSFMCNPSRFDTRAGSATFAHCTIPTAMLRGFSLNTHFESGIGCAVQGAFEPGACTVFKCAGDLSRYHVQEGALEDAPHDDMLCRTQVRVRLADFSYFLTEPISNHHLICLGHRATEIGAFFKLL